MHFPADWTLDLQVLCLSATRNASCSEIAFLLAERPLYTVLFVLMAVYISSKSSLAFIFVYCKMMCWFINISSVICQLL